MRTILLLCVPSLLCTMALMVWGLLQWWHPGGLLGWLGMAALWAVCGFVNFLFHVNVANRLVPDAPNAEDAVRRQMDRIESIARINDAQIDDPDLRPRERVKPRR